MDEDYQGFPYDGLLKKVCGEGWQKLSEPEIDGAWGIAIVRAFLDGVAQASDSWALRQIANHLGVSSEELKPAFMRLSLNGVFHRGRMFQDKKALNSSDVSTWCYYAGVASGAIGNVKWRSPYRRKEGSRSFRKGSSARTRDPV